MKSNGKRVISAVVVAIMLMFSSIYTYASNNRIYVGQNWFDPAKIATDAAYKTAFKTAFSKADTSQIFVYYDGIGTANYKNLVAAKITAKSQGKILTFSQYAKDPSNADSSKVPTSAYEYGATPVVANLTAISSRINSQDKTFTVTFDTAANLNSLAGKQLVLQNGANLSVTATFESLDSTGKVATFKIDQALWTKLVDGNYTISTPSYDPWVKVTGTLSSALDVTAPTVIFDGVNYGVADSVYGATYASVVGETYKINVAKIFGGSDIDSAGYAASSDTSNVTVSIDNGILSIVSNSVGASKVNVTAKDLTGNVSKPAVFSINVLQSRPQDDDFAAKLAVDKSMLNIPTIWTSDMQGTQLPINGQFGSQIAWVSNSNDLTIDENGKVTKITQPAALTADETLNVTATITNGTATPDTQIFAVTVPQQQAVATAEVKVSPIISQFKLVKVEYTNFGAANFRVEGNDTIEPIDSNSIDVNDANSGVIVVTNSNTNTVVVDFLDSNNQVIAKGNLDVSVEQPSANVTDITK